MVHCKILYFVRFVSFYRERAHAHTHTMVFGSLCVCVWAIAWTSRSNRPITCRTLTAQLHTRAYSPDNSWIDTYETEKWRYGTEFFPDDDDGRIRTHARNQQSSHTRTHIRSINFIMPIASFFYHFRFLRLEKWRRKKKKICGEVVCLFAFYRATVSIFIFYFFFRIESTIMWSNQKKIFFFKFRTKPLLLGKVNNETHSDAECLSLLHFRCITILLNENEFRVDDGKNFDWWFTVQPNRSIFPSIFSKSQNARLANRAHIREDDHSLSLMIMNECWGRKMGTRKNKKQLIFHPRARYNHNTNENNKIINSI